MKMAYLKLKQYRSPIFPLSVLHNKDLSKKLTSLNHTVFLLYIILDKDLVKPLSFLARNKDTEHKKSLRGFNLERGRLETIVEVRNNRLLGSIVSSMYNS